MKLTTLLLGLTSSLISIAQTDCLIFDDYSPTYMNDLSNDHATYPIGTVIQNEGNIDFLKIDTTTNFLGSDTGTNEFFYVGGVGLNVASSTSLCKNLTFYYVGPGMVIDGDTVFFYGSSGAFTYSAMGFHVECDGSGNYAINGAFDQVNLVNSTSILQDVCLEECSYDEASCLNFGLYSSAYLSDISSDHVTYPVGSTIFQDGYLILKKENVSSSYLYIDSAANMLAYDQRLEMDVSTAPYTCRVLSFTYTSGGGWIEVDGETVSLASIPSGDSYTSASGFTVSKITTNEFIIEGEFDSAVLAGGSSWLSNICLEECITASCIEFGDYDATYLSAISSDHTTYPVGSTIFEAGYIEIIKVNEFTNYDFISPSENKLCITGTIGIDVSSAPWPCKSLSFELDYSVSLVIDDDTLTIYSDTTISNADWTLTVEDIGTTELFTIEGDFDYVSEIWTTTNCYSNVCLEECVEDIGPCINFGDYDDAYLDDVTTDDSTYPVGSSFIEASDIQLIKHSSSFYQFINAAENEMCYIGELGIDVSSASYSCRVLTFEMVAGSEIIIDGDTIDLYPYTDTLITSADWEYERDTDTGGKDFVTITGDFDYVEVRTSTICISNICLEECIEDVSSCINFGDYDDAYLDDVTSDDTTYPAGSSFIEAGDLHLIKHNTSSFYQFIDSTENQMCYIGELGIDVSSASYSCRLLTFEMVAGSEIIIDGDTIDLYPYTDTLITSVDWEYERDTDTGGKDLVTITGDFDYVEVRTSTICISNICLEECDGPLNLTPNTIDDLNWTVYPNPMDDELKIQINQPYTIAYIFDLQGKIVASGKTNLNTSELESGMYLISLVLESGEIITKKIIKK